MRRDKKNRAGRIRLVLLEAPGRPVFPAELPERDVRPHLNFYAGRLVEVSDDYLPWLDVPYRDRNRVSGHMRQERRTLLGHLKPAFLVSGLTSPRL
jgi:hypothetical protein